MDGKNTKTSLPDNVTLYPTPHTVVCATEGFRYTLYGGVSFAFPDREKVYIMEYHS